MSRNKTKFDKSLSEAVADLVSSNGGWLHVIGRMTNSFDTALGRVGKPTDCPFSHRHSSGGGKGDFRFTDNPKYEGRAICTCMQDKGMSPVELLMEDGIGSGDWTSCMLEVLKALSPETKGQYTRKESAPKVRTFYREMTPEIMANRKEKLTLIARDLVPLEHPAAEPARKYFAKRGIPVSANMADVKFHRGLEYWITEERGEQAKKVLAGVFPAIVSAFRNADGRVVNFHRIFIDQDGNKAAVEKPKKICSPLPGFRGSSITVARAAGRTLHVTEGIEKAWAIHLATGETVKAAYSCSSLPALHVDKAEFDHVYIWSDCDPVNPKRKRKVGDGQYFAWELARRLFNAGIDVTFLMPAESPVDVKGRDWEDVIVQEGVLDLDGFYFRVQTLKRYAAKGGVEKLHSRAA